MTRIDPISGAVLPEASLYEIDFDADFWTVHQYWLACEDPARFPGVTPLPANMTLEEVKPDSSFAKQMYWDVGGPWIWGDRRVYSDQQWVSYTSLPQFRQFKLFLKNGDLAGYAETSFSPESRQAELEYFGMLPHAIGSKAGPAFLSQIIAKLWDGKPRRIRISTCTFDHPGAFRVYSRCGFERLSSHAQTVPNAVAARIISPQEIQIRRNLLR